MTLFLFQKKITSRFKKNKNKAANPIYNIEEIQVQRSIEADDINGSRLFGHHRAKHVKDCQQKTTIDGSFLEISITSIVCHHGIDLYVNHKASYQGHLRFAVSSLSTTNP